jgi:hypothetical protein
MAVMPSPYPVRRIDPKKSVASVRSVVYPIRMVPSRGHTLSTSNKANSVVYFAREKGLARNIPGRQGWLRKLRFGLLEYDNRLYLARYDF